MNHNNNNDNNNNNNNKSDNIINKLKIKEIPIKYYPPILQKSYETLLEGKQNYVKLAGVAFNKNGRMFTYRCDNLDLKKEDPIIIEVPEKGPFLGWIIQSPILVNKNKLKNFNNYRSITRKATEEDLLKKETQEKYEKIGMEKTLRSINKLNLPMKILKIEYTLDLRNATVYFASENRVDFRELLKDLIHDLKARVELRQIGVRDQARMKGAIGYCGEETCCSRFINKFHGVSIKMAKDQELSLKTQKVSGICGRLKCCLAYEHNAYLEALKSIPRKDKCVKCAGKCGVVKDIDILRQKISILTDEGNLIIASAKEVSEINNQDIEQNLEHLKNKKIIPLKDIENENNDNDDYDEILIDEEENEN